MRFETLKTHALALATAAGLALVSGAVPAVIISVDTLEDSVTDNGNCSLREAVIAANTNAAVDGCPAGTGVGTDNIWVLLNGTINLSSNLLLLEKVSILGAGKDVTTVSGQGSSSVFYVNMPDDTHDVTITNLTIADGSATLPGAGLLVDLAGTVRVENCRFRDNHSSGSGFHHGGAIGTRLASGTSGSLEVVQCEFIDNSVAGFGGAIGSHPTAPYVAPASVEIDRSSFVGNHGSQSGGALYLPLTNSVSIDRSRFHANELTGEGGGGAMAWLGSTSTSLLTISNSSFTANSGGSGGALRLNSGISVVTNSTFSKNIATSTAGNAIYSWSGMIAIFHSSFIDNDLPGRSTDSVLLADTGATIQMTHSIVWTSGVSAEPSCATDGTGVYTSLGFNIDGGTTCVGQASDHAVADPGLFELGDYGDNTGSLVLETFLPRPGGLAIDGGKDGPCTALFGATLATDQRGEARPTDGDGSGGNAECDIGAVEYQPGVDPIARTLNVATTGAGYGRIENTAGDLLCTTTTSPCSHELPDGSEITLTATANFSFMFTGWSGDCAGLGTGSCTVTMAHNRHVIAEFQPAAERAILQVVKTLKEAGLDAAVTSAPSGINCGATCNANFAVDDVIVLTASPQPGTVVIGWSGCDSVSGGGLQCTITLTGDSDVGVTLSATTPVIFADSFEE